MNPNCLNLEKPLETLLIKIKEAKGFRFDYLPCLQAVFDTVPAHIPRTSERLFDRCGGKTGNSLEKQCP